MRCRDQWMINRISEHIYQEQRKKKKLIEFSVSGPRTRRWAFFLARNFMRPINDWPNIAADLLLNSCNWIAFFCKRKFNNNNYTASDSNILAND